MAPKSSEKEDMLNALSKRIFSAMLDDIIFDVALQAHHEVLKGKSICQVCQTRCGSVHLPGSASHYNGGNGNGNDGVGSSSRGATPSSETGKGSGSANGGTPNPPSTGTPSGNGNKDGTVLLDCVKCQRQIASNRYAPHLASCMGLKSARRGTTTRASSNASVKPKLPSDTGRSASPASETGNASDEKLNAKGKGKAKISKTADESEGSLKRKRPQSPQTSPTKVNKKAKASGSPVSRVKAESDTTGPATSHYASSTTSNKTKIPSKLRESSTTSFVERSPSVVSSRSTSPAGTPGSSVFSAATQSPNITSRVIGTHGQNNGLSGGSGRVRGKAGGTGPPARRVMSPPRPPAPPKIVHHASVVPDYGIHDGGDETGSSTDTDSD